MTDALILLAPIYLLIALGIVVVRTRYFPAEGLPWLSLFTLNICVPVLVFSAVAQLGNLSGLNLRFVLGYSTASLIVLIGGQTLLQRGLGVAPGLSWMLALGMSASNSIFLGLPILSAVYPDHVAELFAGAIVSENIAVVPLCVTMAAIVSASDPAPPRVALIRALRATFSTPIIWGLIAGLLFLASGLRLPTLGTQVLGMIAAAAPVLALVLAGGTLATARISELGLPVLAIAGIKLFVHPVIVWAVLTAIGGLDPVLIAGGTVLAALPMVSIFTIFAGRHGGALTAASGLVLATVAGLVTVSVAVAIFV
ncbi:MAG: AEC family transporter [Qingshengfaniella sp.]